MLKQGSRFWLGNAVLVVALLILLNIGVFWERMGVGAMVLWAIFAGVGGLLVMSDKNEPGGPD